MEVIVQVYISKNDHQWGPFDLNQLARLKGEGPLKGNRLGLGAGRVRLGAVGGGLGTSW